MVLRALRPIDGIVQDPPPDARWAFNESGIAIRVRWWTGSERKHVVAAQGRAVSAIRTALRGAQIELPYPTRVVLFHDWTEETDGDRARQREGWPAGRPWRRHP